MKMNDKMKVIVCSGLAIVLCLIGYSCGNNENGTTEVETEQKQEEQIEKKEVSRETKERWERWEETETEAEVKEEVIEQQEVERHEEDEDENLNKEARNGEYQFEEKEEENNNLELAREFVESVAIDSMGDTRYQVITEEESNTVILIMHIDEDVIIQGIMTPQWDELTENCLILSQEGKKALDRMGFSDVNYAVYVGDIDQDSMYFASLNGTLIYNAKDKLN